MTERYQNYCTKCKKYQDYDCDLYRREGEDTHMILDCVINTKRNCGSL